MVLVREGSSPGASLAPRQSATGGGDITQDKKGSFDGGVCIVAECGRGGGDAVAVETGFRKSEGDRLNEKAGSKSGSCITGLAGVAMRLVAVSFDCEDDDFVILS